MTAIKTLFYEIAKRDILFKNPFNSVDERLKKKFRLSIDGAKMQNNYLTKKEITALLDWLKQKTEKEKINIKKIKYAENYALIYMLVTSGMRAFELLQLRWEDIEFFDEKLVAKFIGKGDKMANQELYEPAVKATEKYFELQFGRKPKSNEFLFYNIYTSQKMKYPALRMRLQKVGEMAYDEGILKRSIKLNQHVFRRTFAIQIRYAN